MDWPERKILRCLVDCGDQDQNSGLIPNYLGVNHELLQKYALRSDGRIASTATTESKLFFLLRTWFDEQQNKATLEVADRLAEGLRTIDGDEVQLILADLATEPVPREAEIKDALKHIEEAQAKQHLSLSIQHANVMIDAGHSMRAVNMYVVETGTDRMRVLGGGSAAMQTTTTLPELMNKYLVRYGDSPQTGPMTGVAKLDDTFKTGLTPGSLTLIIGQQYVGKTALLLYMLTNIYNTGDNVIFVSCEQDPEHEVLFRIAAQRTGIAVDSIEFKTLTNAEKQRVMDEVTMLSDNDHTFYLSPPEEATDRRLLLARLRSLTRERKIGAIGVDFATLIDVAGILDGKQARGDQEVLALYQMLRDVARGAGCPLIVVHPLAARPPNMRKNSVELEDLSECKGLRFVATNAILVEQDERTGVMELTLMKAKNRRIAHTKFGINFDFKYMTISEPASLNYTLESVGAAEMIGADPLGGL